MRDRSDLIFSFDFREATLAATLDGFSGREEIGRWTDGPAARTILQNRSRWPTAATVRISLHPCVDPTRGIQIVRLKVNETPQGEWRFTEHFVPEDIKFQLALNEAQTTQPLVLEFEIVSPAQPSATGPSQDDRHLGIMVRDIEISGPKNSRPDNPYRKLPDHCFWSRGIAQVDPTTLDPVIEPRFKIAADARVGTAGSCFAQHISRRIMAAGFNYLVTEDGAALPQTVRTQQNYGTFSARYGNIYTPAQLLQLWQEAFDGRVPLEQAWQRPDGRYIDPLRQQIQPQGFESAEALVADRQTHLQAVRRLFDEVDVFVFTLGLTEAWRSRRDGTVVSAAPGVAGGRFDPELYEFANFTIEETYESLKTFLALFHERNPGAKVLLTVSPVPLMATYENRSVLTSTIYSKSVLRVAAEKALMDHPWVDYFPSYEIITGSPTGGLYYEEDFREVNARGVSHAMRCFLTNYLEETESALEQPKRFTTEVGDIICDEEILNMARS